MEGKPRVVLFNEQGIKPGTTFEKGQWRQIATHNNSEIKGFFGEYRFLNNGQSAKVFLDEEEYKTVENAYQAAKYKKEDRGYFKSCSFQEAIIYSRENQADQMNSLDFDKLKIDIMRNLLVKKFDIILNPDLYNRLFSLKGLYLEETNYWRDIFWGVNKIDALEKGIGENNLGKILMEIASKM